MNRMDNKKATVHAIVMRIIADVSKLYHLAIFVSKIRRKKKIKLSLIMPNAGIPITSKGQNTFPCQHPVRGAERPVMTFSLINARNGTCKPLDCLTKSYLGQSRLVVRLPYYLDLVLGILPSSST